MDFVVSNYNFDDPIDNLKVWISFIDKPYFIDKEDSRFDQNEVNEAIVILKSYKEDLKKELTDLNNHYDSFRRINRPIYRDSINRNRNRVKDIENAFKEIDFHIERLEPVASAEFLRYPGGKRKNKKTKRTGTRILKTNKNNRRRRTMQNTRSRRS